MIDPHKTARLDRMSGSRWEASPRRASNVGIVTVLFDEGWDSPATLMGSWRRRGSRRATFERTARALACRLTRTRDSGTRMALELVEPAAGRGVMRRKELPMTRAQKWSWGSGKWMEPTSPNWQGEKGRKKPDKIIILEALRYRAWWTKIGSSHGTLLYSTQDIIGTSIWINYNSD